LSVYGIGKQRSVEEWRTVARALLHQGLVDESQDGYPVLSLNARSPSVLRGELEVHIAAAPRPARAPTSAAAASPAVAGSTGSDAQQDGLFDTLRELRKRLADEHGVPPYVVFHDATLREMILRRPLNLDEFAQLHGVGEAKLARYGEQFIAAIRAQAAPQPQAQGE
jgi:ATP-dependent DNA helicase RecQ